jgi:hypothetical protein
MWRLSVRDQNRDWTELGAFVGIGEAALQVMALERDPAQPIGAVSFRVYADPALEKFYAVILSRLEYQGAKNFYVLKRLLQ